MYGVLFPLSNYMLFSGLTSPEQRRGRVLRCPQFRLIWLAPTGVILSLSVSLFYWIMALHGSRPPLLCSDAPRLCMCLRIKICASRRNLTESRCTRISLALSHLFRVAELLVTVSALKVKERKKYLNWNEILLKDYVLKF
jgi:hypothetical protein